MKIETVVQDRIIIIILRGNHNNAMCIIHIVSTVQLST